MSINISVSSKKENLSELYLLEQQQDYPWTKTQLEETLNGPYETLVLKLEDKIIGFIIYKTILDEAEIINFIISKDFRQQGYGNLLLTKLISELKNQNIRKIFLEVRASNLAAIRIYQKFGFKQINIRKNYYRASEKSEDAIMMILNLESKLIS